MKIYKIKMKYLTSNKHWKLIEEYNLDKLLYLLIDRSTDILVGFFIWKNNKEKYHRDYDLPAWISPSGWIYWRQNNLVHRENNKPALIYCSGIKHYYKNDKFIK